MGGFTLNILRESDFRKEIKTAPRTAYLFFGDEDYLKLSAVRLARETLCPDPSFLVFNEMRPDALDFTPDRLIDALMPMPMMADRKLIVLSGLDFTSMKPADLDALCDALSATNEYDYNTVLVLASADTFDAGYLPKRPSATLSKLSEVLTPVQFDRSSPAKLATWVARHFQHNGIDASPEFCARMITYCGSSMFSLANEIDKLSYFEAETGKPQANETDMKFVCTPATEYDAFAFANAMMDGKRDAALAILRDYKLRRVDPLVILGDVVRVFCDMVSVQAMLRSGSSDKEIAAVLKLHEFKVGLYRKSLARLRSETLRDALTACGAADRTLKLSPQGYTALERLICSV